MYKLIRYFNQNRQKIFFTIIAIVFGLMLLQFANNLAENKTYNSSSSIIDNEIIVKDNINIESAITGTYGGTASKTETEIIEQFIQYCNEGNSTEAYNMLSKECKENMYPSLEQFIKTYYSENFRESKSYDIQRWSNSIYKVDFKKNILHTGKISAEGKQDYITVVHDKEGYKLNINSYIGRTQLNNKNTVENISIEAIYKDRFLDYETYTFEIKNNNNEDIYLDNLQDASTIYILDDNGVKHVAYVHELGEEQLHIYANTKKQIQIKFSNNHITKRQYSHVIFENVILDKTQSNGIEISIKLK